MHDATVGQLLMKAVGAGEGDQRVDGRQRRGQVWTQDQLSQQPATAFGQGGR